MRNPGLRRSAEPRDRVTQPHRHVKAFSGFLRKERILHTPDFRDNLLAMGAEPFINTPQQFGALMKADMAKYAKIIRDANLKLE